jgi:peptidoglycan/LPS O-acetylase OafA/YrhL
MDSLLWGAVMAIVINPVMDRPRTFGFVPGLLIVGMAGLVLFGTFQILYEPGGLLFALTFTIQGLALIPIFYIGIMHHNWGVFRWLNWRPVRYLGTISYTMYLVHMPLLALFDSVAPGTDMVVRGVVVFAATVGVAHLSYVAMERPLARLRRRLHARGAAPPVTPPETSALAEPRQRQVGDQIRPGAR